MSKKFLLFFLIIGGLFFSVSFVHAEVTLYEQTDFGTAFTISQFSYSIGQVVQATTSTMTTSTDPIFGAQLSFKTNYNCSYQARLQFYNSGVSHYLYSTNLVSTTAGVPHFYDFVFSTTSTYNHANEVYMISIQPVGTCNSSPKYSGTYYGSSSTSTWSYGDPTGSGAITGDLYFTLASSPDVGGEPSSAIWFNPDISAQQCEINNWQVEHVIGASDYASLLDKVTEHGYTYGLVVNWGNDPDHLSEMDMTVDGLLDTWVYNHSLTTLVKDNKFVPGQVYYAQTCICESDNYLSCYQNPDFYIACSEKVSFTVPPDCSTKSPNLIQGDSANTIQTSGGGFDASTCLQYEGAITQGFCKILGFLFIPDQKYFAQFSNIKDLIATKPPFGYLGVYVSSLEDLGTATSTTSTISADFTDNLSTISSVSLFSTIYSIITWILWLLGGFFVFHRLRHFSLHG